ncbi:TPA: hypothetical protein OXL70_003404 [Acinetobacter baumannii]|nr:hypothetical protein [Acinetobacter baumannii]MBE2563687.1 hypothetical protein [Acinetobacter baumannii]HCW4155531.1 hypothetical protein [Acinetobacter baumannii]
MTDLNKLRSEFEIAMKSKHILDLDFVQFHELSNKYLIQNGLSGEDFRTALDASHVVNVAWLMFQEKAKAQAVPEGYVLLPRVPTEKMFQAYERYSVAPMSTLSKTGYKAMVEAAGDQNENS